MQSKWEPFWMYEYSDHKNIELKVGSGSEIDTVFPNIKFDVVTMNMVLLNVPTKELVGDIFKSISDALTSDGKLIFSDLHPIALMSNKTTAEIQTYSDGFSYFEDGSAFTSSVLLEDHSWVEIEDIHWTLETYTELLAQTSLCITKIIEPQPIKNAPRLLQNYSLPEHFIFVCKKIPH